MRVHVGGIGMTLAHLIDEEFTLGSREAQRRNDAADTDCDEVEWR